MKINKIGAENIYNRAMTDVAACSPSAEKKAASEKAAGGDKFAIGDKVQISEKAREYSAEKRLASSALDEAGQGTSPERLAKLKNAIASGNYRVPADKIAGAILSDRK